MKSPICSLSLFALATQVLGHGRLLDPPHRGWIGRIPEYNFIPIDYSDNGLSAGGIGQTKEGKHGVCGDPYTDAIPRAHENGGMYGQFFNVSSKAIAACYSPGQKLSLTVQVTANHKGYFEFDVCKLEKKSDVEIESCFKPLLQPNGEPRWPLPPGNDYFKMEYVLPNGLTCEGDSHCVLRWHYTGGNNYGGPSGTGVWGQEHFWNCADIYISNTCGASAPPTPAPATTQPTIPPVTTNPGTISPVTTAPTTPTPPTPSTTAPPTSAPTTSPAPGDKCDGNRNTCYWPENHQIIPYSKADCLAFSSFVWCP